MNFSNDIPGPEVLNALRWENLVTRRAKTKAKTMYKVLNELALTQGADACCVFKISQYYK